MNRNEPGAGNRGKHRILTELKRLEQEAAFLEEELVQLEKMEKISAECKDLQTSVEARPDPLLAETIGSMNPLWDPWFEPQGPKGCSCWIL